MPHDSDRPPALHSPRRGVTLVEVLVAVTVLATGAMAAAGCLAASIRTTRYADDAVMLGDAARSVAERLRAGACDSVPRVGALDSAGVSARWTVRRTGDRAWVSASVWRSPVARPADSVAIAAVEWCGP